MITWTFPSREESFEHYITDLYHEPVIKYNGYEYYFLSITEADSSAIRQIAENSKYDIWGEKYGAVGNIVTSEAKMYFAGDATLDATIEKIQNRVQLYLDENF